MKPNEISDIGLESPKQTIIPFYDYEDIDFLVQGGDLSIILGPEAIKKSIVRLISTPLTSYGLLVKTYTSDGSIISKETDFAYGSDLMGYLGEPINSVLVNKIKEKISALLKEFNYIDVTDIETSVDTSSGLIVFNIYYKIESLTEVQSVQITTAQISA